MKSAITYTSTLSPQIMAWLDAYASREGVTKKAVIEAALSLYRIEHKKKKMAQMFKMMSGDGEMHDLAEAGLGDYVKELTHYEK